MVLEDARPGTEFAVADPRVDAEVRRVSVLLEAAEARERAERRRMEGDYGGAGEVLRESANVLHDALPGDPEAAREAAELSSLATALEEERFVAEDVKYMKQRAYDARRSKNLAADRYRRG